MLRKWEELPAFMRTPEVRPYWESLNRKRGQLFAKRVFDLTAGLLLSVVLAVPMAVISVLNKKDSEGPVFYRQERVTTYGRHFRIHKFRTMVADADKIGTAVIGEGERKNVRKTPDASGTIISKVYPGMEYPVYERKVSERGLEYFYVFVEDDSEWGWISSGVATLVE